MIRGALILASQQTAIEDPVDYMELAGLKDGMASVVERELTALDRVIKDLAGATPRKRTHNINQGPAHIPHGIGRRTEKGTLTPSRGDLGPDLLFTF